MANIEIRDVLFATDLSPESDRALDHAGMLAEKFGARLTLYHAAEVPDPAEPHWAFAHEHQVWCRAEREARHHLLAEAERLPVACTVEVERVTSPPRAILRRIRQSEPDLTVMAMHGPSGVRHLLLGSVTEQVFRHAFHPILCVREPEHGPALGYRRLLLPTDLSFASRLAFGIAALIARAFGSEVIALFVIPPANSTGALPLELPSERSLLESVRADFDSVPLRAQIREGPVWERIACAAREEKADMIVMATRGHDSLSDILIGSNTDRVVRHAPCPVLVA
jgi:nucleotide-binding universal stress UspA family protein